MAITAAQKETRKSGLFSSDIARIMTGQSVAVALEKLGRKAETDFDGVQEIELGQLTEPYILQAYEERYGCELEKSPDTIMHPSIPWMGTHIDARKLPQKKVVVEGKTVGVYNIHEWGNPGTDQTPFYPLWQSVVHMACTDADRVDVAVCFMTLEATKYILLKQAPPIHVFPINRDFEAERMMIQKATFVQDCIERGVTPPPETLNDARLIWAKAQELQVEATAEIVAMYNDMMTARAEESDAKKRKDAGILKLQTFMGVADVLSYNNQKLATWKNDKPGIAFNQQKFSEEQEMIYKLYLEPKEGSRRFLPKELKS